MNIAQNAYALAGQAWLRRSDYLRARIGAFSFGLKTQLSSRLAASCR
jgi:hypothetical protein